MVDLLVAGAADFSGGQDAFSEPDRIAENSYQAGINVTAAKGCLRPRWAYERKFLKYPDGTVEDQYRHRKTHKTIYEGGKFQAAFTYRIDNSRYIVIVISGFIYLWNVQSHTITYVPIQDGARLNSRASRIHWAHAGKYAILYDYPDYPIILEGLKARRANPDEFEVPVARMGAFNHNRLFILNGGDEFTAGDPVGSLASPNAPITFEELMLIGSPFYGQVFQLPTADPNERITYMGFLQVSDVSTGIGPMIIATKNSMYTYMSPWPRDSWTVAQFGSLLCYNAGVVGPRAFVNVNSDAFFLAADGLVRSLSMSRDEQQRWARVPMSSQVSNWFKSFDKSLLPLSFVSYFNNKVFFSVNPYRMAVTDFDTGQPISDYAHGGLVVLEMDNLTYMGQTSNPTWAGLWTGVNPMDMVVLEDTAYLFCKEGNVNAIYEINPELSYDSFGTKTRMVRSRVYTRSYSFEDPFSTKDLHSLDLNLADLKGHFKLSVEYKPSHGVQYVDWENFSHHAPSFTYEIPPDDLIQGYAPHAIKDITLGSPDSDTCNPITQEYYNVFKKMQLCLTIEGEAWTLNSYRIKATPLPQNLNISICEPLPELSLGLQYRDDWSVKPFDNCEDV